MSELDLGELHPKQSKVFTSPATEILFGGAAGPGKSHLLRIAAIAWSVEIPGLQVYLFRRTYSDLWQNHMDGPSSFPALLAPWVDSGRVRIVGDKHDINFANGSQIHLRHLQYEKNKYNYQGSEMHVLLFDELTQFTRSMYAYLRGRVRMVGVTVPDHLAGRFPRILAGTNPGGSGHTWVKGDFVDVAAPFELTTMPDSEGGMTRQYIPALYTDNPNLLRDDPNYLKRLEGLGSPDLVRALLHGDWDIVQGGAFDDVWQRDRHVIPPFEIPKGWYVDRSFDWGSSRPFSVGWWAESDGSEATMPDGTTRSWPRGTLFRIAEWYGWNGTANEGIRMTAREIARGIRDREKSISERVSGRIHPGPADSSIFSTENGNSIAGDMETAGVTWQAANKAPGSRKLGWERMRGLLSAAMQSPQEKPGLFVFENCSQFIRTVPVLPRSERDPEDVDTDSEDHVADEARYRVLAMRPVARRVKVRGV